MFSGISEIKKEEPAFFLLKERFFLLFFLTVFLSNVGSWIQNVALSWLSLSLKNTASSFGFITFLGSIPNIVFPFLGGYLADNFDNKKTLIVTQSVSMSVAVIIGVGVYLKFITYGGLAIMTFINGISSAISYPVYYTFLTSLVETNKIPRVIALHSVQFNVSRFIGPLLFGIFVVFFGLSGCFLINAVTYIPLIFVLAYFKTEQNKKEKTARANILKNIKDGFVYILENKGITVIMAIIFVYSFLVLPFFGMLPYVVKNFLEDDPKAVSVVMGLLGVGALTGASYISFFPKDIEGTLRRFVFGGIFFPIALFFLGFSKTLFMAGGISFVLGFMMVFFYASGNAYLNTMARQEFRGRVVSFFTALYLGVYPIGIIVMGFIAEHINISYVMAGQAIVAFVIFVVFSVTFCRRVYETQRDVCDTKGVKR